jgi:hypothetical protein
MKNIHLLPTQNEITSKLFKVSNELKLTRKYDFYNGAKYQNIYITSDKEIKDDWCYDEYNKVVFKNTCAGTPGASKKIILTTDQDLIKDGVQAIDDEFLEWFVKNPSCEFVKIVDDVECLPMPNIHIHKHIYKIIIPQEKPKEMSKQTAVEWFNDEIIIHLNFDQRLYLKDILKQAKEMEKEQIKDAYMSALPYGLEYSHYDKYANKYYNETYKKEEK